MCADRSTRSSRLERSSPGDCVYCGERVNPDEIYIVLGVMEPGVDVSERFGKPVEIDLCGHPLRALVVSGTSDALCKGADVYFLVCSGACAKALRRAAELHAMLTGREPAPVPAAMIGGLRLTSKTGERATRALCDAAATEPWIHGSCAWCLADAPNEGEVIGLQVLLNQEVVITGHGGGMAAIVFGGRPVPGFVAEPGTPGARKGQICFLFCSQACSDETRAVIERELRPLSVN